MVERDIYSHTIYNENDKYFYNENIEKISCVQYIMYI